MRIDLGPAIANDSGGSLTECAPPPITSDDGGALQMGQVLSLAIPSIPTSVNQLPLVVYEEAIPRVLETCQM